MCVIITLSPGATINKNQLINAVYNNWHGYGLVLKDENNRLQLIKKYSEDAVGTDPEEVWKLLEDNKDITRYLHLRHATRGGTTEENIQPFEVYNSNSRQVFFMHNGTLSSFGSYTTTGDGKSDTREFCEKILAPSLLRWVGPEGKADYTDEEFYRLIMEKHWISASTGLFVSNDLPVRRIGNGWSEYKHPDDSSSGEVWTSNTSYYDKVQRGPMFLKMETIRKAKEEEERKASLINDHSPFQDNSHNQNTTSIIMGGVTKWSNHACAKNPRIIKAFNDIYASWDFDDPKVVERLMFITYEEWVNIIQEKFDEPYTIACLMESFVKVIFELNQEKKRLIFKNTRYSKKLAEFHISQKDMSDDCEEAA